MIEKKKETILFVDDEESILEIAGEYFSRNGYEVLTAGDGIEAVKVIEDHAIDCCFTDINMPGMDGLELAEYIRTVDNTIPVIVMTGYPSLDNTLRTLKNGVVDFLIKPVNLDQMEICVRRVMRERRLFIENVLLNKELEGKERLERLNRAYEDRNRELEKINQKFEEKNNKLYSKIDELHLLTRIMSDFTTVRSSGGVFRRMVEMGIELTRAGSSSFYVIDDDLRVPVEIAATVAGGGGAPVRRDLDHVLEKLLQMVAADEEPLLVSENNGNCGLPEGIHSFMAVPLKIRDKVFGLLTVGVNGGEIRFSDRDLYYLSLMTQKAAYAIENLALYENIYENLVSTLKAFVSAVEAKDVYTRRHSSRVADVSRELGRELGCSDEELTILEYAGQLHDIGKIGVRDAVLLKPGRLTEEEYEEIKQHPVIGANIVGKLGLWDREKEIIMHHHEHFDGSGYPFGLAGSEIPRLARILSVADAYDAMASNRAYRKKMDHDSILAIVREGRGSQFDPEVANVFVALYNAGRIRKED